MKCKCGEHLSQLLTKVVAKQYLDYDNRVYSEPDDAAKVEEPRYGGRVSLVCTHGTRTTVDFSDVAMHHIYGDRCLDFEPGCPTCEAWLLRSILGRTPTESEMDTAMAASREEPGKARVRLGRIKWK